MIELYYILGMISFVGIIYLANEIYTEKKKLNSDEYSIY